MTITLGAVSGPARSFPGTSQALSFGSVTTGQLVTFEVVYWNPVGEDPLVVGDVTQTAGTAVLGQLSLDRQDGVQADTAVWLRTAVFSAVVTTGGTLTLTVAGLQAGAAPTVFGATFNSTAGWSDNPGRRVDGAGAGAGTAANSLTAWSSGDASGAGTSALNSVFCGVLAWNTGTNAALSITGGLFSSIGVENDGTSFEPGASSYYIVSTPTSAPASWSGTMVGAATEGASATLVSYREGTAPLTAPATLAPDLRTQQRPPFLRRDPRRVAPDPFDLLGSRTGVEKWFAWELTVAGGAGSHPTSGALAADAATIAGTAAHRTLHATSGALAASAATLAGVAAHRTLHATTGALVASSATIAGTAAHRTLHATSGALVSGAATIAGSAAHHHATTGALAASAATIAGTATHTAGGAAHPTSGALSADAATIAGTAAHRTLHATSGALLAQAATLAGTAAHHHATTGALVSGAATISGAAEHTAPGSHDAEGSLLAGAATIAGVAEHIGSAAPQASGLGDYAATVIARRRQAELDRQLERQRQAQRAAEEEVEARERSLVRARSEKTKERERARLAKAQEQQAEQARLVELIAQELAALMAAPSHGLAGYPVADEEEEALILLLLA